MASKSKGNSNQNIKAFVRVRPLNASEQKSRSVVEVKSEKEIFVKDLKQGNTLKTFSFDNVFGPNTAQIEVYRAVVQPLIDEVLRGYNCTVFAYGQTGTGKTFTMEGERTSDTEISWENDPLAGIVPRTLSQLFDELRLLQVDFSVKVSFLELYNEELFDLLSPADDMARLRIFEDSTKKGAVIVNGLEEVSVFTKADVYSIMKKGSEKRQTASTLMNARSSRSHTVFTVTVHIRESTSDGDESIRSGKINLVDLAGSENIGRSGAVDKRAREAGNINQSLLTLGRVITSLVDRSPHIPYRESKLTRILQESLGGRTKTSIIATISPSASNLEETLSTLDYAHRAKNIQNKPEINQRFCKKTLLKEYSGEIERLQRDLEATRQRIGVYLAQTEYDDMMLRLEQQAVDIKSKEDEMTNLVEELERKKAICDELSSQIKVLDETVKERSAVKDEQVAELSKLKTATSQIVTDTSEKDYLMLCHMETFQNLANQTDGLLQTTVESTKSAELLFDKIDRTRNASQQNETSIQEFARKNSEISTKTKDLVQETVQSLSCAVSEVSSLSDRHLTSVKVHLNNAMTAAEEFSTVQKEAATISQAVNDTINQESELQAEMTQLKDEYCGTYPDNLSDFYALFSSSHDANTKRMEEKLNAIDEAEMMFTMKCETSEDCLSKWSLETPKRMENASDSILKKMDDFVENHSNSVKSDDDILEKYFHLKKICDEKFEAIAKLASELNAYSDMCDALVEAHNTSVEKSISTAITVVEEANSVLKSAVDVEKSEMNSVFSQISEVLDVKKTQITNSASEIHYNPELIAMESISQRAQSIVNSSASFKNDFEEKLRKDVNSYECLTQLCDSHSKVIQNSINRACESVKEHANHHAAAVELWTADVQRGTENLSDSMQSLSLMLNERTEDYEEALDDVLTHGAKPATPTGKTPLRSDLRIPRDLAATSPHERILNRLRDKYRAMPKMSPGDSPDSVYSDADSDLSLCESDIIANKENPRAEKECPDKNSLSYIPKMRKPLAQNN